MGSLPKNRIPKEKSSTFTIEKPGRLYFKQAIKINSTDDSYVDVTYPVIWGNERTLL